MLFRFICSSITKMSITDPTSGYQAFNKKVLQLFVTDAYPVDYPDADVILMLYKAGLKIKESPVIMFESTSKKSMHSGYKPLYYIFKMFLSIFVTLLRKEPKEVTNAN